MNDYERIAQMIKLLDEEYSEQPSLADLADRLGLSVYHFHRLFSEWAGVTPKVFLRCLTHAHAKRLLVEGMSVLDVSMDLGLSGPSRLHDLCVDLEAATPGEVKSGGLGWTIVIGFAESPFGEVTIGENGRGICYLAFTDELTHAEAIELVRAECPGARLERNDACARVRVSEIFGETGGKENSRKSNRAIKAYVKGTPMQIKVWRALLQIPSGQLTTYGDLAAKINMPGAARATGSAVGANSIAYLIPCHRVIRITGALSGYRWGVTRKKAMIARETSNRV